LVAATGSFVVRITVEVDAGRNAVKWVPLNAETAAAAQAARQKECEIEEGHLQVDHAHMLLTIPPKYAVSQVAGYLKGKRAIHIARTYVGKRRNFVGEHFWARGFWVSTVGWDEAAVRL
jgi:REP element-mobilizing transposase RayT